MTLHANERIETVVIGGGQTGLSVGYHLAQRGRRFVILDAGERVGDAWRNRWDSLRLFTPARYNGLDGMPFPASPTHYPTKDEMADYLEAYADRFQLPVRLGTEVDRVSRNGDAYMVASGDHVIEADNVVVAMAEWQKSRIPAFSSQIRPEILQMHSSEYRRPSQLQDGDVLVVGAANSGAEIALDLAGDRRVWLAGRHPGHIPFDTEGFFGRHVGVRLVVGFFFHHVLKRGTPIGKKVIPKVKGKGMPLVRTKPRDLAEAGVRTVGRIDQARNGLPLADGETLEVANIVWANGYRPGFSWIDVDVFDGEQPRHESGEVAESPGLYFVGLTFLHAASSHTIRGVGRDAARIADAIADRAREPALV